MIKGVLLLEEYAVSFQRELPREISIFLRTYPELLAERLEGMNRE